MTDRTHLINGVPITLAQAEEAVAALKAPAPSPRQHGDYMVGDVSLNPRNGIPTWIYLDKEEVRRALAKADVNDVKGIALRSDGTLNSAYSVTPPKLGVGAVNKGPAHITFSPKAEARPGVRYEHMVIGFNGPLRGVGLIDGRIWHSNGMIYTLSPEWRPLDN